MKTETIAKILEFTRARDWDQFHTPENLAKSISIEAGELLENFQWNNDFDKEKVLDELADVMTYGVLMADKLGVEIDDIILRKLEKSEKSIRWTRQKETVKSILNYKNMNGTGDQA